MKYLFDMGGTLVDHHDSIDDEFKQFMIDFANRNEVYIVTGATHKQVLIQLGPELLRSATAVYNLNGSMKIKNGEVEYLNRWKPSMFLIEFLTALQHSTKWKDVYPNNIDIRDSFVNFSIVGRDCTPSARQSYFEWDKKEKERETICRLINECYPELDAIIAGQISVDISPVGTGKDQVLSDIDELGKGELCFFGDRMNVGGNDYSLASRIARDNRGDSIHVDTWQDTFRLLSRI